MKNWIIALIGVAMMLCAAALIWSPLATYLAADSCLDAGGSYNYASHACDLERSHPYAPENHFVRLCLAFALAVVGSGVMLVARVRARGASVRGL